MFAYYKTLTMQKQILKIEHSLQFIFKWFKDKFEKFPAICSIISLTFILLSLYLSIKAIDEMLWLELENRNELGDAFGGITNPIIAFLGVFVTFLAFYIQYKFNREQSKLIAEQRSERIQEKENRDLELGRERFDRKFYELLKMHSENVKEFNIDNRILGKKSFVYMYKELSLIHEIVKNEFSKLPDSENVKIDLFELSYSIFFHGIDNKLNYEYMNSRENLQETFFLFFLQSKFREIQDKYYEWDQTKSFFYTISSEEFEIFFYPFDGHSNRLGHYFRNLHNFVQLIDNIHILSSNEKQTYFDVIRAQLSNYEQAMLYYNTIAWFQDEWYVYFVNYQFIKNLPLELANIDINPKVLYSREIDSLADKGFKMFQWVDLGKRYTV